MNPLLTIQLLGWNSALSLAQALPVLHAIPREQVRLRYIDNGSTDHSVKVVQNLAPEAEIIRLATNRGFSGGHNAGIARTTTPYILILNPDVEIVWEGIVQLLRIMEHDQTLGALQGKLLRNKNTPSVLDSAGIMLSASLNGRECGAGEIDSGQYNTAASRLAVTGACSLYRHTALRQVQHNAHEFFDADFFAYKEDVDLGWRLNRAGWVVRYEPIVTGYHTRTLRSEGRVGWGRTPTAIMQRLRNPRTAYSFRNWLWLINKNASGQQLLMHAPFIVARLMIFALLTLGYPPLIRAWFEAGRGWRRICAKRSLLTSPK